jgi:UDP:flavonoid glycosyltransferase YjiC (YdhE family)
MHYLITALGSYGDVYPMVGLGKALAARGHRVQIVTNPYFEDVVAAAGLELVPIGAREHYVEVTQHPDLWHPLRGPRLVLQWTCVELLRPLYEALVANYVPGETVFCAHVLDMAGRTAGEKFGAPVAAVDFSPVVMWSVEDSPRLRGALLGSRAPKWFKRLQFWVSDAVVARRMIGGSVNGLRRELGLPPVRRFFSHWLHAVDLVLCLYPDWFAPPQPDWPANTRLVGFPLWDSPKKGLPDGVQEFLEAGDPPIAFSPGSANRDARRFFSAAVEACERLGRRGILMTKYAEQLPTKLPPSVRHFGFVPMSRVLPHTAALVHHGGIGNCAQGLAAGVPHLVQPMSYDQFDNSRRLVRLGVAEEISVRRFRGAAVAEAVARLLESPDLAKRCRDFASRCDGPASLAAACNALERLANERDAR